MATSPNYYTAPTTPESQFNTNQQQYGNNLVPNKDTTDPTQETEEQRKARLGLASEAQPVLHPQTTTPAPYHTTAEPAAAGTPGTASGPLTPMVQADGSVPPGEPYTPAPIHVQPQPVARAELPQTGPQDQSPPYITPGQFPQEYPAASPSQLADAGRPSGGAPQTQPTGRALEDQWMDFANTVLGQKGQVGVVGGNAQPNSLAASSRNNLQPIVDQYNQKYGAVATAVGEDKIDFHDGRGPVDVIQGGGADSKWWFGGGGGDSSGAPGSPAGGSPNGPVAYSPPPLLPAPITPSSPVAPGAPAPPAYTPDLNNPAFNQTPPSYNPQDISQYTALDQSTEMGGLNDLVNRITGAPDPTYDPTKITQFSAPDQGAGNTGINQLVQQILSSQGPSAVSGMQDKNVADILSNPTYSDAFKNALGEQQKELITQRGVSDREALLQNAARRGVTDSGRTEADTRRLKATETGDLLKSNRDIEINTAGANRQSILDALAASQGLISSRGANANAALGAASGALTDQSGRAVSQFGAGLAGQTAQAGENAKAFDSKIAAGGLRNQSASTAAGVLGTQANIAQGNFGSKLSGETAKAAEAQKAYQAQVDANTARTNQATLLEQLKQTGAASALDRAKFGENQRQFDTQSGLARDQFNESTRQFNASFIEQVRQFDKQLAQQMEQFNKSNELGWANNQQGYDIANLNSTDRMLDRLAG